MRSPWRLGGDPPNADLTLAEGEATPRCDPRYHDFVDYIVLDRTAAPRASGFREWTYSDAPLSNHCAISVALN